MNVLPLFAELAFRGWFPLWLAVVLGLVSLVAVYAIYSRESLRMPPFQRYAMAAFRVLAIWVLLFLLCKPVLVDDFKEDRARPIAVLIDNSKSMLQADPRLNTPDQIRVAIARGDREANSGLTPPTATGELPSDTPTRVELLRSAWSNPKLNLATRLREKGPVAPYLIGQRLRGLSDTPQAPWIGQIDGQDNRSALVDALNELLQRDENELPAAVVLVTDGRDNGSTIPADDVGRELARLGIPIQIYGVGGSSIGFLQLKDIPIADTLFADDTVTVPFRWRSQGFSSGEVELSVTLGGKPVGQPRRIPAKPGEDLTEAFSFTPTEADAAISGPQELVTSIKLISGGQTLRDEVRKSVRVVSRKVRVLVVDREPRWEFKFLQRTFLRDRRTDATFLLTSGDREAQMAKPYIPVFPQTRQELFENYDLLVLGDVPASYFTRPQQEWIRDFVSEGGGFVLIAGSLHAPADYVNTPLADVLPVRFNAVRTAADSGQRTEEFVPKLSPVGLRSAMMSLSDSTDENERLWRTLPGFHWYYPVTKLAPAAVSLLEHPTAKMENDKPMSLMAMQYYGKGLSLFCGSEESWRWRWNETGDPEKYFSRFWGQVIYQIGLPRSLGGRMSQIALEQPEMVLGKTGRVFARLFTRDYTPLVIPKVTARLEKVDARPGEERFSTVTLDPDPDQKGEYRLTLSNDREGRFALTVDSGTAEPTKLEYRVTLPPEHELARSPMNEEFLRKLAELSGGSFYREEDLYKLPDNVLAKKVAVSRRQEKLLWNWEMMLLFVGLLTMEWLIRKFSNLS